MQPRIPDGCPAKPVTKSPRLICCQNRTPEVWGILARSWIGESRLDPVATTWRHHQKAPSTAQCLRRVTCHSPTSRSALSISSDGDGSDVRGPGADGAPTEATALHAASSTTQPWPALEPPFSYNATAEDAQSGAVPTGLSPLWQLLLLSDGSVTRHLQLLTGAPVQVECLSMCEVGDSLTGLPSGTELIPGPRVQRQVLLRCRPRTQQQQQQHHSATTTTINNNNNVHDNNHNPSRTSDHVISSGHTNNTRDGTGIRNMGSHAELHPTRNSNSNNASTSTTRGGAARGEGGAATTSASNLSSTSTHSATHASGGGSAATGDVTEPPPSPSSEGGYPLVFAASWWNAATVDGYLRDRSKPIWVSLSQGHVELYREIHSVFRGSSAELESLLGCSGPFWGRQYIFWSGGEPLTLIYEVFSPRLAEWLGQEGGGMGKGRGREGNERGA